LLKVEIAGTTVYVGKKVIFEIPATRVIIAVKEMQARRLSIKYIPVAHINNAIAA
jgi:hypothetical protein